MVLYMYNYTFAERKFLVDCSSTLQTFKTVSRISLKANQSVCLDIICMSKKKEKHYNRF